MAETSTSIQLHSIEMLSAGYGRCPILANTLTILPFCVVEVLRNTSKEETDNAQKTTTIFDETVHQALHKFEDGYRKMALDAERERDAHEWCNALIRDAYEAR